MQIRSWIVGVCVLAGCKGQSGSTAQPAGSDEPTAPEKLEGEIPLVLGDCAPTATRFISGPDPQAFEPADLATPATALYASTADGGDFIAAAALPPSAGKVRRTSTPYRPGVASPLAELRILLVDCFRQQDQHYAAAVFDLAPGSITVHGIEHPAFATCLASIASQVKVAAPLRCAASFGTAGASSLPALDITSDGIAMLGTKVTDVAAAADDHVKATLATKAPLTLHGPIAVRPLPATPMRVVTETLRTLVDHGDDPVLAAQRDGVWQLVRNYPLPVVPVPLGTGGSWNSRYPVQGSHDRVTLSVLVGANDVVVGPSGEHRRVAFDKLKAELTRLKSTPMFADRADIEIAGADDALYSRVVDAIDIADGVGFVQWSLTSVDGSEPP